MTEKICIIFRYLEIRGGVATFDSNLPAKSEVGYQPGDYHHMLCLFWFSYILLLPFPASVCVISFHRWNKQNTVTYSNLCKLVSSAPLLWINCLTTQTRTYEVFTSNSGQGHYKIHEKHEQNKKTIPSHYIWLANPVKLKVNESKKHEIKRNFHISSMWPNVYTKKWHFYRKVFRIFS